MKKKLMALLLAVAVVGMYSFGSIGTVFADNSSKATKESTATHYVAFPANQDLGSEITVYVGDDVADATADNEIGVFKIYNTDNFWYKSIETIDGSKDLAGSILIKAGDKLYTTKLSKGDYGVEGYYAAAALTELPIIVHYYVHIASLENEDASKVLEAEIAWGGTGQSADDFFGQDEKWTGTLNTVPPYNYNTWTVNGVKSNFNYVKTTKDDPTVESMVSGEPTMAQVRAAALKYNNNHKGSSQIVIADDTDAKVQEVKWYVIKNQVYTTDCDQLVHVDGYVQGYMQYALSYNANTTDATKNVPSEITYHKSGAVVGISDATPTRDGYTFKGWSTKSGDNNTVDYTSGDSVTFADSAITLYAVWEKDYTAKYDWGTNIPQSEANNLPVDTKTYKNTSDIAVDTTYTSKTTVNDANGTWTFSGWDCVRIMV